MLSVKTILQLTCVQLKEPKKCNLNNQITLQLLLKEKNNLWQLATYSKRHQDALKGTPFIESGQFHKKKRFS